MIKKSSEYAQSGNVLFMILIAVALFAALSYAVTSSSRSGGNNASRESLQIEGAQIAQYVTGIQNSIMRMKISSDCDDTDISFENPVVTGYGHTPAQAEKCQVFHVNGGGMSYSAPDQKWLDAAQSAEPNYGEFIFTGQNCVAGVGSGGPGFACWNDGDMSNQELLLILPWITRELCIELNNRFGVTNPGGNPPQTGGNVWSTANLKFTGTYTENAIPETQGGVLSACMEGNMFPAAGTYHFYHTLIAR